MKWLKRGLCGMDLRKHTYIVATFDLFISVAAMIMGFVVIIYPEQYVTGGVEVHQLTQELINETQSDVPVAILFGNSSDVKRVREEITASREQFHYVERIKELQNEIVEGIITAMVTIVVTLLLIYGVKTNKCFYFLPWLVENVTGVAIAFGVSGVKLLSGTTNSVVGSLVFMFVVVPCYCYWVYGVASLYTLLRRMKAHTHEIISSITQGSGAYHDGVNFEQVHEELQKEMQVGPPANTNLQLQTNNLPPGFRREDVMYFSI